MGNGKNVASATFFLIYRRYKSTSGVYSTLSLFGFLPVFPVRAYSRDVPSGTAVVSIIYALSFLAREVSGAVPGYLVVRFGHWKQALARESVRQFGLREDNSCRAVTDASCVNCPSM